MGIISHKSFFLILLADYVGIFSQMCYICRKIYTAVIMKENIIGREREIKMKSLQLTFITTFGVKKNAHSWVVNNEVLLEDLFC